ncbi:MAG: hypothetical protein DYG85_02905 [Chloroflexi bacterium CFX1]|nr:hypothetical protein [Chloroflexi bacterium CFX1]MCQ3951859.1 hypothetical protein [Chloroflexota bacterium]MDL1917777.1 hypothetical protein [Chloroflexi bacterium CFX5]NUQ58737.1 hypothetical protein [Anaerolineales bacterium]
MNRRTFALFVLVAFAVSACNLPGGQGEPGDNNDADNLALTVTAQALLIQQGEGSQQPSAAPENTATPEFTATPGATSTPSVPQVTVSQNTNCRTGPGIVYDNIGALLVGQVGTVVGKNSSTGYWIINNPGKTGTCWLYPQYATVSGNTANLQEYSIPPTPTPSATPTSTPTATLAPPAAVANVVVAKICIPLIMPTFNYSGTLSWEDKSNNEDGFNIYFNGALFTTLPANTTVYAIPPIPLVAGIPATWGVEAFNAAGKSAVKDTVFVCP